MGEKKERAIEFLRVRPRGEVQDAGRCPVFALYKYAVEV